MGVRGLSTYVRQNQLFEEHHLHDCPLVIDGLNLLNTLYFKYQRDNRNDHMYGGDYSLWAVYVRNFFNTLKVCGVVPIVILDGSFDPSLNKLKTKLKRFTANLSSAFKIYKNNCFTEGINPLLTSYIFTQILHSHEIHHYQSIYEADDIIPQIGKDLNCPILSNDSDFLIDSLPGGVIPIDYLLDNFRVFTFEEECVTYKYIRCYIYKLENLKQKFSRINLDLVQLCSPILGNDYIDHAVAKCILSRIPKFAYTGSNRQKQINSVLQWISRYDSYENILRDLRQHLHNHDHRLLQYIESHFNGKREAPAHWSLSIQEYFAVNLEKFFFFKNLDIPLWAHKLFIMNSISNRLLCIREVHIEWFRPLVEDFSFGESSYECVYDLCQYIFGLLRSSDENVDNIKRYSRRNTNLVVDKVMPHIQLDGHLLPMLKDLEFMSEEDRLNLFYKITQIDPSMGEKIKRVIRENQSVGYSVNELLMDQFVSMLLLVQYFSCNFANDLWLEFFYALFANIFLSGHFCAEDLPVFLQIDSSQRQVLNSNLYPLSKLPTFTHTKVFMPRVVHFFNSFQNCLLNVDFLAEILRLPSHFSVKRYVFALKGTFLYNLTCDLASRTKPLLHLEELLGRQKFLPLNLFRCLLDFVLANGNRKLLINGQCDRDVVGPLMMADKVASREELVPPSDGSEKVTGKYRFVVRAFEVTNRKTHINSQKLKLRRNRSRK